MKYLWPFHSVEVKYVKGGYENFDSTDCVPEGAGVKQYFSMLLSTLD